VDAEVANDAVAANEADSPMLTIRSTLPDCRKNNLPSGTFIANSPGRIDAVVGTLPGVKLRLCNILSAISIININMFHHQLKVMNLNFVYFSRLVM
jgi:hypothetical protein